MNSNEWWLAGASVFFSNGTQKQERFIVHGLDKDAAERAAKAFVRQNFKGFEDFHVDILGEAPSPH
jgi:hypothetical protein